MTNPKHFIRAIIVAMAMAVAIPASAEFHFGLKAGGAFNKLMLDTEALTSDFNYRGFTAGVMAELMAPAVGIGMDASVLYARRAQEITADDGLTTMVKRDYIDVPINLKWKIQISGISKFVTPFITTGPDISFFYSKKDIQEAWQNRRFDFAWNVGAGLQLFSKLQLAASYGFGLTNSATGEYALNGTGTVDDMKNDLKHLNFNGKNRCWTFTLAFLF